MEQLRQGIDTFLSVESDGPVLLEVFTDAQEDERAYKNYLQSL
jgi:2-succinyl-5-enolpyruvyl-6-hydroxy-3-cyclohexene-1-carboxylate synthase